MLINVAPLVRNRNFRLLYFGQLVSAFGSMFTYVAIPYQIFELTHSSFWVGMLSAVQLIPLLVFGLYGGAYADAVDRRKLLIGSEVGLAFCALILMFNASAPAPSVPLIFVVAAVMSALNGFHRPALDAATQGIVSKEDLPAISALGSLRWSLSAIVGPAIGGILIARYGIRSTYGFDSISYLLCALAVAGMRGKFKKDGAARASLESMRAGLAYAMSRPELIGTYVVDMVAMTFAMPMALFPSMALGWGGASAAGTLYSGMSIGVLIVTLFSGWIGRVERRGAAVILSAAAWGVAIVALGFAPTLSGAVFFLALAGAADGISGLYRGVIWNETIPNEMRGRLSAIEMISYMSGPLLGNARAGWMAAASGSNAVSITAGGVLCVIGVLACIPILPGFWRYRATIKN